MGFTLWGLPWIWANLAGSICLKNSWAGKAPCFHPDFKASKPFQELSLDEGEWLADIGRGGMKVFKLDKDKVRVFLHSGFRVCFVGSTSYLFLDQKSIPG